MARDFLKGKGILGDKQQAALIALITERQEGLVHHHKLTLAELSIDRLGVNLKNNQTFTL